MEQPLELKIKLRKIDKIRAKVDHSVYAGCFNKAMITASEETVIFLYRHLKILPSHHYLESRYDMGMTYDLFNLQVTDTKVRLYHARAFRVSPNFNNDRLSELLKYIDEYFPEIRREQTLVQVKASAG